MGHELDLLSQFIIQVSLQSQTPFQKQYLRKVPKMVFG